ncbi:MAG: CHAP domain-containing protein [Chitinophagales bacterium]
MIDHSHPAAKRLLIVTSIIIIACIISGYVILKMLHVSIPFSHYSFEPGTAIDSINGTNVYFNGETGEIWGRNVTSNGYNIGLKWQCVEFVKRYYYEHFDHVMPDSYGNAKDIFDRTLPDASYNTQRALVQYQNPSLKQPAVDDIIVFDGHLTNKYGHIAIISKIYKDKIEIIQQNPGPDAPSREEIDLAFIDGRWKVMNKRVLGWMRIE